MPDATDAEFAQAKAYAADALTSNHEEVVQLREQVRPTLAREDRVETFMVLTENVAESYDLDPAVPGQWSAAMMIASLLILDAEQDPWVVAASG